MDLSIACSLEGRDLALVKSIININNIFGELNLTYVEQVEISQVLIAKTKINGEAVYFAEDRLTKKKYPIRPNLTPRSIRALFKVLTHKEETVT